MKVKNMKKIQFLLLLCLFGCVNTAHSITAFNLIRPFDPNFFPACHKGRKFQIAAIAGFGDSRAHGRTVDGRPTNVLQRYYKEQDALAMLKGFPATSQQAQLGQQINVNDDNNQRGHFAVTGDLKVPFAGSLWARFNFNHNVWVGVGLPIIAVNMKNVQWVDLTQNITLDDALTHDLVTDNFAANVAALGDGLQIGNWKKAGVGDLALYGGWRQQFFQEKKWIKEAIVNARIGVLFPTSVKKNQDIAVSFEFGNDGAFAIPLGAGLDLRYRRLFWAGLDIMMMKIFSHTKERRIQLDPAQTDLLLLQKAVTRRQYGMTQMFNLYLEPIIYKGLSMRFAYECIKHGDDHLYTISNDFSSLTSNMSLALEEWTTHDIFIQAKYDQDYDHAEHEHRRVSCEGMLFAKIPFNGKASFQVGLVGFNFTVNF